MFWCQGLSPALPVPQGRRFRLHHNHMCRIWETRVQLRMSQGLWGTQQCNSGAPRESACVLSERSNKTQQVPTRSHPDGIFLLEKYSIKKIIIILISPTNTNSSQAPSQFLLLMHAHALLTSCSSEYCKDHLYRSDVNASKPSPLRSCAERHQLSAWQCYVKEYSWKE